ncbi:MFS transporter [Actinacidiphila acidipaludis]|uniref:MFS transporter n=1 Tax=Actinacidiphila acidipaludis TaxID=2873382 RepID=A0ABS7PZL4_9ACTN|nr:MFS transporter [Streptomyces acidipaludis]MBY8876325.1 MFS transporter [Streptomyces acidipaludis]
MTYRPQRDLGLAQLANSVGDGAFYVSSALYFTHVVGLSPARVGLGLTLAWAVGSLVGVPLGRLADRRGARGTSVLLALATCAAVASFLAARGFPLFVLSACAYASAQAGLAAARQALLAGLVPAAERTGLLARLQSTLNAGLAVGAALGGLALTDGTAPAYRGVLALDALCYLACALLLRGLPSVPAVSALGAVGSAGDGSSAGGGRFAVLRDRPYALVALLNAVLLLRLPLLSLALPLWITERTGAPAWSASGLFVLNTLAVTLFQVRTARTVTGVGSALRLLRRSGAVMFASCAVFALSAGRAPWVAVAILVAGEALQVAAEMQQSAGAWQLSFDLAPADRIGEYQGFFGTGVTIARTAGPLVVTSLLLGWGLPGWLLLGALMPAAAWAMGPAARAAERAAGCRPGADAGRAPQSEQPGADAGRAPRVEEPVPDPALAG